MRSNRGSRRCTAPVVVMSTLFALAVTAQPASATSLAFTEHRPALGFEPFDLRAGDVDGDGIKDLVLGEGGTGGVAVARGNGDGTFGEPFISPPVTWSNGRIGFAELAVGDVNADGRADVAVGPARIWLNSEVQVLLGRADGTLAAARTFTTSETGTPDDIAIAALDGDGNSDLVMPTNGGSSDSSIQPGTTVSVLLSNGDGTFGAPAEFAANRASRHVAVADVDEDGHLDVVVANDPRTAVRKTVSVLPGNGDGTLSEPRAVPLFDFFGQDFAVGAMVVADINRDGHRDVAVVRNGGGSGTPRGEVLFGNGNGTFSPIRPFSMPELELATGDFNGDGRGDLVAGALMIRTQKGVPYQFSDDIYDPRDTSEQSHLGNGLFGLPENHLPSGLSTQRGPIVVADFDGDGRDDIAAIAELGALENVLTVLLNRTPSPPAVNLASLTLNESTVVGGSTSGGTVRLDAPAPPGGTIVELNSTSTCGIQFHGEVGCDVYPAPVTVPEGQTSADFSFTTSATSINFSPERVTQTIIAQLGGVTMAAPITSFNPDHHGTVASWTYTCTGLTCQFDGSGSTSQGSIVSYEWFFGQFEGSASGQTVTHTFSKADRHLVNLTVTDQNGNWNRKVEAVTPLTAVITFSCSGLTCELDGLSSMGGRPITSYAWDFGDGTAGTGAIVRHTYASPGTHRVTLTVTDDGGATDPETRDVAEGAGSDGLFLSGSSLKDRGSWRAVVTATGSAGKSTSGTWSHGGAPGGCEIPPGETSCFFVLSDIPNKVTSVTYTETADPDRRVTISKP
jgi:PKD repeat protein